MKTTVARLLLGTAVVAAGLAGSATAAQAVPAGCSVRTGLPNDTAEAR